MKSPYKKILVFDYETGGFSPEKNAITEFAIVAIDLETLEIIDQCTALIKPRLDLGFLIDMDTSKAVKQLHKDTAEKDLDTGVKVVKYKDKKLPLNQAMEMAEDYELFMKHLNEVHGSHKVEYNDLVGLEKNPLFKDIVKVLFDFNYNPSALAATRIPRELFESEGIEHAEAFNMFKKMVDKHTHGNSKPIMAGHNIGTLPPRLVKGKIIGPDGFDNPFSKKFFEDNGQDYFDLVNDYFIDTLKRAREIWTEAPSHALGSVANLLGMTLKDAHRALPDTLANANVLVRILKLERGLIGVEKERVRRKFNFNF